MSSNSKIPAGYTKPQVAIIYSENDDESLESKYFGHWLAGCLASTGYAHPVLIGFHATKMFEAAPTKRIKFYPMGKTKPQEAPSADITFGTITSIVECHIVIICVNAEDAGACGERLNKFDLKQHKYNVTIFSLVRGVRSSGALKDELGGNKKTAFIEGVVGFAVVPNPVTDALTSTIPNPSIALERMSTETADIANGAVNLLEALDWTIIFRKVLTPLSWGVIVYECLYALNTVTGGTINDTLFIDNSRVIFACMIRECRHSLLAASRGGKWRPDLTLVFASGNLWCFEMILALPNPFFGMAKWIFGLPAANSLGPGCVDLAAGRETCILAQLEELISSGSRHTMDMHICQSVADRIKSMESALGDNLVLNKPVPGKNQLQLLMSDIKEKEKLGVKLSSSTRELLVWLLRMFTAMSLIYLLWFVFIHDY